MRYFSIPQLEKSTSKAKDELAVIRHDTSDEDVEGWVVELQHIAKEKESGKYTGMYT
jgi:nanoRNase/pAp phosphatase (c-di-AMP/oligoRNAs hydrolase)